VSITPALEPAPVAPLRTLSIARLSGDAGRPAGASTSFRPGERIRLLITPSDNSHVYCYLQDQTRSIVRFYPNRFGGTLPVSPAAPLEVPGAMAFELVADGLKARETVACFASAHDVAADLPPSAFGSDFARLPATSLDEIRDAFARVSSGQAVEARFRIDVR
jgi:hypothetical protein